MDKQKSFEMNKRFLSLKHSLFTLFLSILMVFTAAAPLMPVQAASGNMQITPIDFGDAGVWGDCTMLSSGGKNLLMDTYLRDEYDTLINYLDDHHFYNFDIYLSHYHYDHMHQIPTIINDSRFNVGKVYLPDPQYLKTGAQRSSYCQDFLDGYNSIVNAANRNGCTIVYLKKGSSFTVGNATVRILWGCSYSSGSYDANYINNNSLVAKVTSGDTSFLTCGDIESEVESQLVRSGIDLSADIYKFNHHGGNTSNTAAFVKKVNPSFAYYNWLEDSPTSFGGGWVQTPINNLKNTCNIYSTRYNGMLTFTVKAGHISVAGERNMNSVDVDIKDSEGNIVNTVNYQFNDALDYHITERMRSTAASVSAEDATTSLPTRYTYTPKFIQTSAGYKYRNRDGSFSVSKFQDIDGDIYYFDENGIMATGWKKLDDKWYYFGTDGKMFLRWKRINGKKYYFDPEDGHMHTGWEWVEDKKAWYYLDPVQGCLLEGWLSYEGNMYYLTPNDFNAVTGWQKIDGNWYFFNMSSAQMCTGWLTLGTKTYYLGNDGVMVTGTQNINGRTYTFNSSGELVGNTPSGTGSGTTTGTTGSGTTSGTTGSGTTSGTTGSGTTSGTTTGSGTTSGTTTGSGTTSGTTGSGSTPGAGTSSSASSGWVRYGDSYKYQVDGSYVTSCFYKVGNVTYYFDSSGFYVTGWKLLDGKWYYFDSNGKMLVGWKRIDGKKYYLDPEDGHMHTGWIWVEENSTWYYLKPQAGNLAEGWILLGGKWYYLMPEDFYAVTGWKKINEKWYFFDLNSAEMKTGWITSGDKKYYLSSNGDMLTGKQTIGGKIYFFDTVNGHMITGWKWDGSSQAWNYLSPEFGYYMEGWVTVNGRKYYLVPGRYNAVKGWYKLDGKWYYFDPSGNDMQTGWLTEGGYTYYLGTDGVMVTGKQAIDGKTYEFTASGALIGEVAAADPGTGTTTGDPGTGTTTGDPGTGTTAGDPTGELPGGQTSDSNTGWVQVDGGYMYQVDGVYVKSSFQKYSNETYYLDENGMMVTGFKEIDGKTYYFDESGKMLLRWKRIDGKKYFFDPEDGHMHIGWEWVAENNAWYYLSPETGYLLEGWQTIDGKTYYLTPTDFYAKIGWQFINNKWYYFDLQRAYMYSEQWLTSGNRKYYLGSDGVMLTGTHVIDGSSYTFDANGALITESLSDLESRASFNANIINTIPLQNTWANASDSDMPFDVSTPRNAAFVNNMLAYATYFVGEIDYASSVTGDDPTGLRYRRLRVGGKTDCSWFVYHVLYKFGLVGDEFVHSYQWGNNPETYPGGVNIGSDVSKASPGDIICTGRGTSGSNSHVMIYLGGNKVVECAAGYGVIISWAPETAREIVHFSCLPSNSSASYSAPGTGTWVKSGDDYLFRVGSTYLSNCFQNIDGYIFYFGVDGTMATGWRTIGGKKYYFSSNGDMYLRWKRIDGKKYYFDPYTGYMHTGWEWVGDQGAWYYLDPDTGYLVDGWQTIDGYTYYFTSDFKMVTGTQTIDGVTYTFASSGALVQ